MNEIPRNKHTTLKKQIGPVWWSGNWSDDEQNIINDIFTKCGDVQKTCDELTKIKLHLYYLEKQKYGDLKRVIKVRSLYTIADCLYSKKYRVKALKQVNEYKSNEIKLRQKLRQNGWAKIRKEVLDKDNNVCVVCGNANNLEVHHIIPFKKAKVHDIKNLITLCTKCHDYISNERLWITGFYINYNPEQIWNDVVLVYLKVLQSRGFFVSVSRDVSSSWTGNDSYNWVISQTPKNTTSISNQTPKPLLPDKLY